MQALSRTQERNCNRFSDVGGRRFFRVSAFFLRYNDVIFRPADAGQCSALRRHRFVGGQRFPRESIEREEALTTLERAGSHFVEP
jgi:hypothetical protein